MRTTNRQPGGKAASGFAIMVVNLFMGAALALLAVSLWINLSGIPLIPSDDAWVPANSLPQILQLDIGDDPAARTEISVLPFWIRLLSLTSTAIMTVMLVMVFRTVHLLARRSTEGRPFAPEVIQRLRRLSIWLVALVLLRFLVDVGTIAAVSAWFTDNVFEEPGVSGGLGTDFPALSLSMIVTAAVAGVLAQTFRQGSELTEATDGLV